MDDTPENSRPPGTFVEIDDADFDENGTTAATLPVMQIDTRDDVPLSIRARDRASVPLHRQPWVWLLLVFLVVLGTAIFGFATRMWQTHHYWGSDVDEWLVGLYEQSSLDPKSRFTLFDASEQEFSELDDWCRVYDFILCPPQDFKSTRKGDPPDSWDFHLCWELLNDEKQLVAELWICDKSYTHRSNYATDELLAPPFSNPTDQLWPYHWECETTEVEDVQEGNRGLLPAVRVLYSCKGQRNALASDVHQSREPQIWKSFKLDVCYPKLGRVWVCGNATGPDAERLRQLMLSSAYTVQVDTRKQGIPPRRRTQPPQHAEVSQTPVHFAPR